MTSENCSSPSTGGLTAGASALAMGGPPIISRHVASSVAATEGSPPSTPRSTLSSFHSFVNDQAGGTVDLHSSPTYPFRFSSSSSSLSCTFPAATIASAPPDALSSASSLVCAPAVSHLGVDNPSSPPLSSSNSSYHFSSSHLLNCSPGSDQTNKMHLDTLNPETQERLMTYQTHRRQHDFLLQSSALSSLQEPPPSYSPRSSHSLASPFVHRANRHQPSSIVAEAMSSAWESSLDFSESKTTGLLRFADSVMPCTGGIVTDDERGDGNPPMAEVSVDPGRTEPTSVPQVRREFLDNAEVGELSRQLTNMQIDESRSAPAVALAPGTPISTARPPYFVIPSVQSLEPSSVAPDNLQANSLAFSTSTANATAMPAVEPPQRVCSGPAPSDSLLGPSRYGDWMGVSRLEGRGTCPSREEVYVQVSSPDLKFNCAHFVAFKGFRERLHGHNYTVSMKLGGPIGDDGYVMDFGDIKTTVRRVCQSLNEYFIVPMRSDVLDITVEGDNIAIRAEDGATFVIPKSDCMCLPIVHSTAEELAVFLWSRFVEIMTPRFLEQRGIEWLEVIVAERPMQCASYRRQLAIDSSGRTREGLPGMGGYEESTPTSR